MSCTRQKRWGTPVLQEIANRVEQGRYQTNLYQVFSFSDLHAAHQMMEENRASGKLVVAVDEEED